MRVSLMYNTPLWVCSSAIRKCWASEDKSDTGTDMVTGPKDKALIERVGNKNKHASTLEHLSYSFDIDGPSRALLQEQARHRISSFSVQSSRYTLEKVLDGLGTIEECLVSTGDKDIDELNIAHMTKLADLMKRRGKTLPRDISKYAIVEAYKTSLVWTINARSLQNFLTLRINHKQALWEIVQLAENIALALPNDHKYLYKDIIDEFASPEFKEIFSKSMGPLDGQL